MSTQASGILNHMIQTLDPMHDLREAWLATLPFAAEGSGDDDGDSGDGADDDGDGSGGDGTDTGDGSGDDGDGSANADDIKNPRIKELSDENAKHRRDKQAEKARADAAEKKLKDIEDSKKTKEDKLESDLKDMTSERDSLKSDLGDANLRISFYESGAAAQLQDPADALKFLDLTELTPDEDGKFKDKDVLKAVEDLIKKKPYLAKGSKDDGDGDSDNGDQPSGRRTSGKKKDKKDLDRQKLEEKFPALRGR